MTTEELLAAFYLALDDAGRDRLAVVLGVPSLLAHYRDWPSQAAPPDTGLTSLGVLRILTANFMTPGQGRDLRSIASLDCIFHYPDPTASPDDQPGRALDLIITWVGKPSRDYAAWVESCTKPDFVAYRSQLERYLGGPIWLSYRSVEETKKRKSQYDGKYPAGRMCRLWPVEEE